MAVLHLNVTRYNPSSYYNRNNNIKLISIKSISYRNIFYPLTLKCNCLKFKSDVLKYWIPIKYCNI